MIDAITAAKALEWDKAEKELAERLAPTLPPKPDLDAETLKLNAPFIEFCKRKNVRHLPSRPCTIASYIYEVAERGVKPAAIMARVGAIEMLHHHFHLSNPVASLPARHALASTVDVEAPRSWAKDEQAFFKTLPAEVQAALTRREADRDRAMRNAQNKFADELRRLNKAEPIQSADTEKQKESENGKS